MRATELRVGNWVNAFGNRPKKVDYLDIRDVAENRLIEPYKPISLTPDILKKCEFLECKNGLQLSVLEEYVFIDSLFSGLPLTLEIDGNRMPLHHIRHLHELQNLYFALVGNELFIHLK